MGTVLEIDSIKVRIEYEGTSYWINFDDSWLGAGIIGPPSDDTKGFQDMFSKLLNKSVVIKVIRNSSETETMILSIKEHDSEYICRSTKPVCLTCSYLSDM